MFWYIFEKAFEMFVLLMFVFTAITLFMPERRKHGTKD